MPTRLLELIGVSGFFGESGGDSSGRRPSADRRYASSGSHLTFFAIQAARGNDTDSAEFDVAADFRKYPQSSRNTPHHEIEGAGG